MATGGWVADLDKKEHKNWVMVGCALNITKNGITPKVQTKMEAWYQSLISSPPLNSLTPCACSSRAPRCRTCITWESELTRHHTSKRPKICWGNSDRKQWGSPAGTWEIAKVFMPTLGSRKKDVFDAKTTDIGGLLNLLEWCPFIKPPVNGKVLSLARDQCRNHWAHAPKQEIKDADVPAIFGHLNSLLSDPVFTADKAAQNACKNLQDLFRQGLVNMRDSEVEALHLLRQSLVADLTKYQDDLTDVQNKIVQLDAETKKGSKIFQKDICELKEKVNTSSEEIGNLSERVKQAEAAAKRDISAVKEQSNINKEEIDRIEANLTDAKENLSLEISTILRAVDDFNKELNERDDLRSNLEVIREDVDDVKNGIQTILEDLTTTKSRVANLDTSIASVKSEVKEVADEVTFNRNTISSLESDVMDVKEEVETLKVNASKTNVDDGHHLCTAPCRLTAFTGRKSALEWLGRNLISQARENQPGTSCSTKAICGLGGCGKTSLALEFAWSYMGRFPGGVFWINAESDENIQRSVVEILALENIPASTSENIDDVLNRFLAWLCKKTESWLLVMDNADDLQGSMLPTGVKKICSGSWQRNGNAFKQGHMLFTTRQNAKDTRSFLKVSCDDCLELECFSEEEGGQFLVTRIGVKEECLDAEAICLVRELGALPLALEQAAAFLSASPIPLSFKDYLAKYQAVKLRLLEQRPATALSVEAQHRLSVHTTWEMNFEFVRENSPAAATIMRIVAFLESENIPVEVINPGLPELDQEELRDSAQSQVDIAAILKILSSYSLFSVHHETRVFFVHKLVQEVVRNGLTSSERTEALVAAIRVLHFALRKVCGTSEYDIVGALSKMERGDAKLIVSLILNFRKLKNHLEQEMKLSREDYNHALFNENTSSFCILVCNLIKNNISFRKLLAELSDFSLNVSIMVNDGTNPDVLLFEMVNTAVSKRNVSTTESYNEAKKMSEYAVQTLNELEESGATINADVKYQVLQFRASFYSLEKQWEKYYRALLDLERLSLPLSDEKYVNLQMNIGNAQNYVSACNFQSSLQHYNSALEIARKIYPWDHPELLRLLQHITMLYKNEEKWQQAKTYAEEMLNICQSGNIPTSTDYYIKGTESALSVLSEFDPCGSEIILLNLLEDKWPKMYNCAKDGHMDNSGSIIDDDGSDEAASLVLQGILHCFWVVSKRREKISTGKLNFYRRIAEMFVVIQKNFYGEIHPGMIVAYDYLITVHMLLGTDKTEVSRLVQLTAKCHSGASENIYRSPTCDYNMYNARENRDLGNSFFKSGDYTGALNAYNRALAMFPNDGKLLTNRAATHVKLSEQHKHVEEQRGLLKCALEDSENAITADPSWLKGYYWKAVCLAELRERGPSLAAAAIAEHLFPSKCTKIPVVVEQFGGYNVTVVNTVDDLLFVPETSESNHVILVKEGTYEVPTPVRVQKNAVIVGLGDVKIICSNGVPLHPIEGAYIENVTLSPRTESTTKLKETAKECLNRGQLDTALSLYSEALTKCPNDAVLLTNRAATYFKLSKRGQNQAGEQRSLFERALEDSEKAITADPAWVKGYYWKAVCLAELRERGPSLAAAAIAEHLFPSKCTKIPVVVEQFGGYNVTVVNTVDDLLFVPETSESNRVILVKEGTYEVPTPVRVQKNAVIVGLGDVKIICSNGVPLHPIEGAYIENVTLSPRTESTTKLKETAKECLNRGQLDTALSLYSEALTKCPNDAVLLTNRAATYFKLSKRGQNQAGEQRSLFERALEDSEKAITADPAWVKGYYWKAVCLAELRERGPSLAAAAIAEHLFPSKCTKIPVVVEQFGGYNVTIVNTVDDLLFVPETSESNRVILVKEGTYEVPTPVRVQKNAVIVGLGDVKIICSNGVPLHPIEGAYIENVTLSPRTESTTKLKETAKECLNRGQLDIALSLYSEALTKCPNDAVLLTNRAATHFKLSKRGQNQAGEQRSLFERALEDSEKAITADPAWVKGYYWKAVCLAELRERGPSLAAAAIAEHLFPSKCTKIPVVVEQFGGYNVTVVNTVDDLLFVPETSESNRVILVKEGTYEVPTPVRVQKNAVIVGLGDVKIICSNGVPLHPIEGAYIENVTLSPRTESTTKLKETAKECLNRGQLDTALSLYSEALTKCPNDAVLLTNRAATYFKLSKRGQNQAGEQRSLFERALEDSEKAITADPAWVKGYYWKAVCLAELRERGPSLAAAAIAEHLFPSKCTKIPVVVEQFGGYNTIDVGTVEDLLSALATADDTHVILVKEGRYDVPTPQRVPSNAVIVGVGDVQIICINGVPLQADETIYIENITLTPTMESITKLKNRAKECLNRGQLDMAVSLYSEALTKCPNDAQLLTARATTYMKSANKQKDYPSERRRLLELALKDSEAAIVANFSWVLGYYNKAASLAELGRKHQALAATAVFKHLSCGRDIPVVTQRFGDVTVQAVENSDELRGVLQRIEELQEVDQVVLLKEGEYLLDKSVEVAQPIVIVGRGKVTVSCKTGRSPFYLIQEHYIENVELCEDSQNCTDSSNTQTEVVSLPGISEDERTNLSSECKVN